MKKIMILLTFCVCTTGLRAQKCLNINILSLMGNLQVPGDAGTCFGACATEKNDHNQTVIVNYGTQEIQLEQMIDRTNKDFMNATMGATTVSSQMPSSGQVADAQATAAKFQGMSDDEKRAYAMQMMQTMQANRQATAANAESAPVAKMVMQTRDIVTRQLKLLDDELAAKAREIMNEEKQQRDAVKAPNDGQCPGVDKAGMPSCSCVNGLAGAYWQKIVTIENSMNERKAALLQSYLPRIKQLVGMAEDNIAKLQYGDAVKTAFYKKALLSAQTGAFGFAFDITTSIVKSIRKTGADAFVNKFNSDKLVYDLSCSTGK